MADLEPVGAGGGDTGAADATDVGSLRPPFAPPLQFPQIAREPFGLHFHGAIRMVAHPAAEPQFLGTTTAAGAVAHPLHLPAHAQPPALLALGGAGLLGLKEAPLIGGGTALAAAAERE